MLMRMALGMFVLFLSATSGQAAPLNVRDHGAVGDGTTLDTAALQMAIDACAAAGGGKVVFPNGTYLSGSLELKSGVHLVLTPEAVLLGSRDLKDYPSRKLISASDATNVAIEGGGTIDGQGDAFWQKRDRTYSGPPYRGTAQFNYEALPRPSFLYFQRCRDVVLRNVTLKNSPAWTVHLLRCQNARVEKVTIRNPLHGPNTDGIDINSSIDVVVRDCDIITGDDGVVLKSTEPGHDHPSRNITVENCRIWSACNCMKLGTETHDRFENIVFRNCHLYGGSDISLERPLSGVAIESVDGAHLSGITVSDITMTNVRAPIFVRLGHRGGNSPRTQQVEPRVPGRIEKVVIRNVTAEHSLFESSITGIPGHCVENITLENLRFEYEGGGKEDWILSDVPDEQVIKRYPEAQMFGRLPAYGLYCRHVDGIRLRNVAISFLTPDPRPMLVCDDVANLTAERVNAAAVASKLPVIWLINTRNAAIQDCTAPAGTDLFVAAEACENVRLDSCDTSGAKTSLAQIELGDLVDLNLPLFRETSPGLVTIDAPKMRLLDPMTSETDADDPSRPYITVPSPGSRDHGSALCRFEVPQAGDYEVWVHAFGPSGESNSFYVAIDRGSPALTDVNRMNQWYWLTVHHRDEAGVSLPSKQVYPLTAGIHTLQLRNRESGTKVAGIVVARTGSEFHPTSATGAGKQ
jgi:polygalacturonase